MQLSIRAVSKVAELQNYKEERYYRNKQLNVRHLPGRSRKQQIESRYSVYRQSVYHGLSWEYDRGGIPINELPTDRWKQLPLIADYHKSGMGKRKYQCTRMERHTHNLCAISTLILYLHLRVGISNDFFCCNVMHFHSIAYLYISNYSTQKVREIWTWFKSKYDNPTFQNTLQYKKMCRSVLYTYIAGIILLSLVA
jgi:hypothetical protein